MRTTASLWAPWLAVTLPLVASAAAPDPAVYAEQLSALRTEVEQLSETLDLEREALRSDLRAAELRRAELESRIRQQELKVEEFEREVARQREVLDADTVADEALVPMLLQAVAELQDEVEAGLPYRKDARLDALQEIADKLQAGTLDPRRAAGRLWTAVEDELRLTRENVMDRQVITLDGEDKLVDVARLGMVAIYFRTEDEVYGVASRSGEDWAWTAFDDANDTTLVTELFDAIEKQVRVGWFDLPWALPEVRR